MVQLNILSGKKAGTSWVVRRFPVQVGRSPKANLRLEEDGVWDEHLQISFVSDSGFVLRTHSDALATVNGEPAREAVLHNGDTISIGALKLQFWLAEARQGGLTYREWLTWATVAAISLGQVALIYWLLKL